MNPTGGTAPDPYSCPASFNDLLLPVFKSLDWFLPIIFNFLAVASLKDTVTQHHRNTCSSAVHCPEVQKYTCINSAHKRVVGLYADDVWDWCDVQLGSNVRNHTLFNKQQTRPTDSLQCIDSGSLEQHPACKQPRQRIPKIRFWETWLNPD